MPIAARWEGLGFSDCALWCRGVSVNPKDTMGYSQFWGKHSDTDSVGHGLNWLLKVFSVSTLDRTTFILTVMSYLCKDTWWFLRWKKYLMKMTEEQKRGWWCSILFQGLRSYTGPSSHTHPFNDCGYLRIKCKCYFPFQFYTFKPCLKFLSGTIFTLFE